MFQDKLLLIQPEPLMWQHGLGLTKSDNCDLAQHIWDADIQPGYRNNMSNSAAAQPTIDRLLCTCSPVTQCLAAVSHLQTSFSEKL